MASSSSSSFPNGPQAKYEVFLSFRGEDTRDNFTSHLYAALCTKKIQTFIDNNLVRGEEISPSLLKAIEESKLSVIIFSENYASSKWCLEEAAKILECKETNGQMVIPVFYRVDPSHVRNQTGSFGDAFANHEKHFRKKTDKVQNWRIALQEAASLAGWSSLDVWPESKLIEEIVQDILKKLSRRSHIQSTVLVGIDSHITELESLCLKSLKISTIGIWGMGGIGKTTIIRTIYSRICSQFEGFYFFENFKEELKKHAIVYLQNKLLSGILGSECLDVRRSNLECCFVKDLLRRKKVLIVVDGVDDSRQLHELFGGKCDLFNAGSKIIVTSRDRHVLESFSVNKIYEVKGLNDHNSLTLFNLNAFKKDSPSSDLMEFSKRVVSYAKGNPLALIVLGSDLFGGEKKVWAAALKKLGKVQSPKIQNVLRVSYDGLDIEQKKIFLDIAYFFKGENRDNVTKLLNGYYSSLEFDIRVLIDKSLITISTSNELEMHDLLQEMAYSIVHEESNRPEERSRLCDPEEVYHVLSKKKGGDRIEGISLCLYKSREIHLESDSFVGMSSLRFLNFYGSRDQDNKVHLPCGDLGYIPDEMRYLRWDWFPSKSLPQNFFGTNLVGLSLPFSMVERLWTGVQAPVNLKFINLRFSKHLTELPDLSMAKKIERINLGGCSSLVEVHSSIQLLNKLEILNLFDCTKLRSIPSSLDSKCLRILNLSKCTNVKKCPKISGNLKELDLAMTAIKEVPQWISKLEVLGRLDVSYCSNITMFPEVTRNIRELNLSGTAIEKVPSSIEFLTGLVELHMRDCKKLSSIPSSICKLKYLEYLDLSGCPKIESFPEILEPMERLGTPSLTGCVSLKKLPSSICKLQSLSHLDLSGTAIEELPSSIEQLNSLYVLSIRGLKCCKNLGNFLSRILNLRQLHSLDASKNNRLQLLPLAINIGLKHLYLKRCNLLEIPSALSNISWLEDLDLRYNNFESLPTSIKQLSKLRWLYLDNCKRLRSLPELPPSLVMLHASGCESLQTLSGSSQCKVMVFVDCLKLDQMTRCKIMRDSLFLITTIQPYDDSEICLPGSEIPRWFSLKDVGSSITIQVPSNWHSLKGLAFCFVFTVKKLPLHSLCYHCNVIVNGDIVFTLRKKQWPKNINLNSDHVVLWTHRHIPEIGEYLDNEVSFEFYSIDSYNGRVFEHLKIEKCGILLLYDEKPAENLPSSPEEYFDALDQEPWGTHEETEEPVPKRLKT